MKISPTTCVTKAKNLLATDLDDETVLMSIESGMYFGMEKTARRIWEILESPCTVSDMIDRLSEEYHMPHDVCASDLIPFLQELCEEGLVVAE